MIPPARPLVSVAIAAYDNGNLLALTLESLAGQTLPTDRFEVVVVDDGSREALADVVARFTDRLSIVYTRHPVNRGRSAARNTGLAAATGDVLLCIDADSYAHPDLVRRHAEFHERRGLRPGVLMGRRYEIDWAAADVLARGGTPEPPMVGEYRDDLRDLQLTRPHRRRDLHRVPWMYAYTHNVSVDRATALAVGGFDESMVSWGMEDVEFFYRVFHAYQRTGSAQDTGSHQPGEFDLDERALCYHLPHYRSWGALFDGLRANVERVYRKHRRYDIEIILGAQGTFAHAFKKVMWYGDAIAAARTHGLARVNDLKPSLLGHLGAAPNLVIGLGGATAPLAAGSVTFDYDAPPTDDNLHLIGLFPPFGDDHFGRVVNVDMWRFLLPDDLSAFALASLKLAGVVDLLATERALSSTAMLPLPFVSDPGYVRDMLAPHLPTEMSEEDGVTRIRLHRPAGVAGG